MQLLPSVRAWSKKKSYFLQLTLCFEALVDHSFTAAATQGPGRTDEEPDKGGRAHVQTLRQREEVRCL